jgi:hypothetical protein
VKHLHVSRASSIICSKSNSVFFKVEIAGVELSGVIQFIDHPVLRRITLFLLRLGIPACRSRLSSMSWFIISLHKTMFAQRVA